MYKKSFILISAVLFILCIFSGFVNATDSAKEMITDAKNTVVDGAMQLGNDVRNGVGTVENDVEDGVNDIVTMDNNVNSTNTARKTNDGYTATRTATNSTNYNSTSTLWVWLIVAIAAIVIIGLVWYYGSQNRTHTDE